MLAGIAFLTASLVLYVLAGYMLLTLLTAGMKGPLVEIPQNLATDGPHGEVSDLEMFNYFARVFGFVLPPLIVLITALVCTAVGFLLLRSAGAVTRQVIAPQDLPILAPIIQRGDEQAISQFIRLSSLSGITGTFTKIGLSGLPLATIFLTIFLAVLGVWNSQFFDLAKLTLGAFLGSFVQRQAENAKHPL